MNKEQALDIAIKAMRAIQCDHDTRIKLMEAEKIISDLILGNGN